MVGVIHRDGQKIAAPGADGHRGSGALESGQDDGGGGSAGTAGQGLGLDAAFVGS